MDEFSAADNTSDVEGTQQLEGQPFQPQAPESNLWGYLIPCSGLLPRIEFHKNKFRYSLGRHDASNDIVLPGLKISNSHCSISWNGKDDSQSEVTILDNSRNRTFIHGRKIGNGRRAILRQGDEVSFGSQPPRIPGPPVDYRFIYRHQGTRASLDVFVEYQFGSELGKGAFATVMKATHKATGELCAVKLINTRRSHLTQHRHTARFAREIEILMTLQHPNIVSLRDIFEDESNLALVMEFVKGGSLLDYIVDRHGLSEPNTQHITKQMCAAMSYIHGLNIVHRDLKPENVLLTDTIPVVVKIANFGLAKCFDNGTFLKTMCGTPSYLAPEVIGNGETYQEYNNLVDSWSMGVTVFSMLTNTSPFIEDENQNIVTYVRDRTVQWSYLKQTGVSLLGFNFVQRLLTHDPTQRMSLSDSLHHPWLSKSPVAAASH